MVRVHQKIKGLHPGWKWMLGTLASLAVLYISLQLLFNVFFNSYIQQELKRAIKKSTRNTYVFDFEDISIHVLTGSVIIENFTVHPDSAGLKRSPYWHRVSIRGSVSANQLSITNISLWKLFFDKKLVIKSITVNQPNVVLESLQNVAVDAQNSGTENINKLLYKAAKTYLKEIRVARLGIYGASVHLKNKTQPLVSVEDATITLKDIAIDSTNATSPNFFVTNHLEISLANLLWTVPGQPYRVAVQAAGFSTNSRSLFIDGFKLKPIYEKYTFSKKEGTEIDRIDLSVNYITMHGLQTDSLFYRQSIWANNLYIKGAALDVFRDKKWPSRPNRNPSLPHVAFKSFEVPLAIDTIAIAQSNISYSEQNPGIEKPGTITFEKLNASIYHADNRPGNTAQEPTITMDVTSKIMGAGELNAHFIFPMDERNGFHSVTGSLTNMPVTAFNPIIEKVAYIRAESGIINRLDFSMNLTEDVSAGSLTLDYENLSVSMLDKNSAGLKEAKKFKSFFANALVIKSDNHNPPLRESAIKFERDRSKSVFNFWWKSLLSGLKDTVGL